MSKERIPLNLEGFAPAPKTASKERKEEIATEAVESGFSARHAVSQPTSTVASVQESAEPRRRGRKRSTNRNVPFAVKLRIETNDAIYDMADKLECSAIAEVIELAIGALEAEIAQGKNPRERAAARAGKVGI
ncbi:MULTISPECIES: hypothetical protein [Rhizobium/Agrobacterium group]|uniref:Stability/partitioning determinant n=1 Tax=Agrobacterium tumefaciens TaxID=358 RepID=A0AAE6BJ61_AGRTU|nr:MULTISPECIES: hypothetical protein [Agrobacterium tumefaciens complex]QCL82888.1 hypothetical protein CFBP5877_27640 [Agrobacterium tumefaciens]UXS56403.1 hypothetical protein FY148_27335 [Agrobacterium tumefaciens]UXS66747.1 hypothetical protein FY147_28070 [Agrobacterium tumefaciens]UXT85486.1 hypothetical protein FY131_28890 [Agrobacterium tumefaciens]